MALGTEKLFATKTNLLVLLLFSMELHRMCPRLAQVSND